MGGRGSASGGGGSGRLMGVGRIGSRLIALPNAQTASGQAKDRVRYERVKAGLKAGRDLGAVQLSRLPNGKLYVDQGRHRLLAARELGIKVRVRISRGVAAAEHGTRPLFR
jgi:hypothetical protein